MKMLQLDERKCSNWTNENIPNRGLNAINQWLRTILNQRLKTLQMRGWKRSKWPAFIKQPHRHHKNAWTLIPHGSDWCRTVCLQTKRWSIFSANRLLATV